MCPVSGHVGLGLSLGWPVGFSGGPGSLKSTEVQQCSLAGFNLVGSRVFSPAFHPVCSWDGSRTCCQPLPSCWASGGPGVPGELQRVEMLTGHSRPCGGFSLQSACSVGFRCASSMVGAAVSWNCILTVPKERSCSALMVGRTGPPRPFTAPHFLACLGGGCPFLLGCRLGGARGGFEQELQVLGLLCRGKFWS